MAVERVIMPKLGVYTEDVLLAEWHVEEGDEVVAGAVVLEMETDKTTAEVAAETSGWVHRLVRAGASVPIGEVVALIAGTREEYESARHDRSSGPSAEEAQPVLGYSTRGRGDVARRARAGAGIRRAADDSIVPRRDGPLVSPRARALLEQLGFSARGCPGDHRVRDRAAASLDRDVAAWAEARAGAAAAPYPPAHGSMPTVQRSLPLRGRRGTIASRMVSSLQTAAQLTSVLEIDVKPLVELRQA